MNSELGSAWKVFELFLKMCCIGIKANVATMLSLLCAAGDVGDFVLGKSLHGYCIKIGFGYNLNVVTALVDMYAKMGNIYLAREVFDSLVEKDVVLWNCLIRIHARNCLVEEEVALLQKMSYEGVRPNSSTFVGLLSVYPASGSMHGVKYVASLIEEEKLELDVVLWSDVVRGRSQDGAGSRLKGAKVLVWRFFQFGYQFGWVLFACYGEAKSVAVSEEQTGCLGSEKVAGLLCNANLWFELAG
ncbi:hypothetical protein KIW84_032949 [Lathyrus oleraceus]|uniref:Pentatricopeptide repeat-containing protein n=1 Tax=Pisum sativum TaxID=3888 RepID=A0A9D4XVK7_PEA|nr:hypothetical protein KIW84_032948 [Pisum sativum]KAI5427728.1 hypothetical protein KIW84_032949 [Pisum sativum]